LNALNEMLHGNVFGAVKVGYGAAYFQDPVVCPCRKVHVVHGIHEFLRTLFVEFTELFDQFGTHLCVGIDFGRCKIGKPFLLDLSC